MSHLIEHAEREMRLAGLYDEKSGYGGMIPEAVMALVKAHSAQGHSGGSHAVVLQIFNKVVNFKTLTPIGTTPDEWNFISAATPMLWQNRRDSTCFSNDGGKTYYSIDEEGRPIHTVGSTP